MNEYLDLVEKLWVTRLIGEDEWRFLSTVWEFLVVDFQWSIMFLS
jgi:hypothetical protein